MAEESWHAARLIPTSGINGAEEQERRATSALLAVMAAVREFGRSLVRPFGAPAGHVETFIEVPFTTGDRRVFPDGLVRVTRGQRRWTALVEVKTGSNTLKPEQLEAYLDVAREQNYDAVITISNEIPPIAGQHPTNVDKRKLKKVVLHHLAWTQVLTEAVLQKEHRGVGDPDQAWILGELIRYLEHPRSGALEFDDMGPAWVGVRDAIAAGTLRGADAGTEEVVNRYDALLRYAGLRLGRRLGTDVTPCISRKEASDPAARSAALVEQLAAAGILDGMIRIPGTVGPLCITADLRAGQVICQVDVDAPREGRPTTRVNWLVRQLRNAPDTVRVEAFALHGRGAGAVELLRDVRTDSATLVADPKREIKSFRIAQATRLGSKRGAGKGSFVDSVTSAIDDFYELVVQHLRAWTAVPPKLRSDEPDEAPAAEVNGELVSTALSSQDEVEPGPAAPEWPTAADIGALNDGAAGRSHRA